MRPDRFDSWLTVDAKGLYCRPGGFHIDPYAGAKRAIVTHGHSDHARPGHQHVLATRETLAIMEQRLGSAASRGHSGSGLWREDRDRRRRGDAGSRRSCARQRAGGDRVEGRARRRLRRLQEKRRSDLSCLRARPMRSLHHRGDLRAAGVPAWRCQRRRWRSCSSRGVSSPSGRMSSASMGSANASG